PAAPGARRDLSAARYASTAWGEPLSACASGSGAGRDGAAAPAVDRRKASISTTSASTAPVRSSRPENGCLRDENRPAPPPDAPEPRSAESLNGPLPETASFRTRAPSSPPGCCGPAGSPPPSPSLPALLPLPPVLTTTSYPAPDSSAVATSAGRRSR